MPSHKHTLAEEEVRWLSVKLASKRVSMAAWTIRENCKPGEIWPISRKGRNQIFIHVDVLDAWMKRSEVKELAPVAS
jgi:hypothetical protein